MVHIFAFLLLLVNIYNLFVVSMFAIILLLVNVSNPFLDSKIADKAILLL